MSARGTPRASSADSSWPVRRATSSRAAAALVDVLVTAADRSAVSGVANAVPWPTTDSVVSALAAAGAISAVATTASARIKRRIASALVGGGGRRTRLLGQRGDGQDAARGLLEHLGGLVQRARVQLDEQVDGDARVVLVLVEAHVGEELARAVVAERGVGERVARLRARCRSRRRRRRRSRSRGDHGVPAIIRSQRSSIGSTRPLVKPRCGWSCMQSRHWTTASCSSSTTSARSPVTGSILWMPS